MLCVDSSSQVLEQFKINAELNDVAGYAEIMQQDSEKACASLFEEGESFDTVVLDPPRLVPDRKSLDRGLRKYTRMNLAALKLVKSGGIFVSCSCSGLVDRNAFLRSVAIAAVKAGKTINLIEMRGQAPCHPVSPFCPESSYLKCAIFRVQ